MTTDEPFDSVADEVAAAEAELKAAQEKLNAAKAKLAAEAAPTVPPQPAPGYYTPPMYGQAQTQPQPPMPNACPSAMPQQPYNGYQPPYYQQPYAAPVGATKDHVAAGLLAIFLGMFGIHKFYLGYNTPGFIMLAVTVVGGVITGSIAFWVIWLIAVIEGVVYLTKSQSEFDQIYVFHKREWF